MRIRDMMTKQVRSLKGNQTLVDAARLMQELDVGMVPVVGNNNDLLGVVTDRDIVVRSIAFGKDPNMTTIDSVMTKDAITITPDIDLKDAARIMSDEKIRRLPVIEGMRLVGIVSLGDLAANVHSDMMAGDVLEDVSKPIGPKA